MSTCSTPSLPRLAPIAARTTAADSPSAESSPPRRIGGLRTHLGAEQDPLPHTRALRQPPADGAFALPAEAGRVLPERIVVRGVDPPAAPLHEAVEQRERLRLADPGTEKHCSEHDLRHARRSWCLERTPGQVCSVDNADRIGACPDTHPARSPSEPASAWTPCATTNGSDSSTASTALPPTRREYSDDDLGWLEILRCLRETGMPIQQMRRYADLCRDDGTIAERIALLEQHDNSVRDQIAMLQSQRAHLRGKIDYYRSRG
nr:hypothetical protein GCM10020092_101140 [Actinoplanes digitatis]